MINLTDIRNNFNKSIATFETFSKVRILSVSSKGYINQKIYSWMALNDLIQVLKQQRPDSFDDENDRLEHFTIRFVVDTNMRIWFAREGICDSSIPAHSDMVADENVYTAGNLVFSKDYTTIIEITNKSGHYLPPFGSLVIFISLLLRLENNPGFPARIAEQIKLVNYQKQTCFAPVAISEGTVSKSDLSSSIPFDDRIETTGEYPFIKQLKPEGVCFLGLDSSEDSLRFTSEKDISFRNSTSLIDSGLIDGLGFSDGCMYPSDFNDFFALSTTSVEEKTKRRHDDSIKIKSPLQLGSFFCLDPSKKDVMSFTLSSASVFIDQRPPKTRKKEGDDNNTQTSWSNNRFV